MNEFENGLGKNSLGFVLGYDEFESYNDDGGEGVSASISSSSSSSAIAIVEIQDNYYDDNDDFNVIKVKKPTYVINYWIDKIILFMYFIYFITII